MTSFQVGVIQPPLSVPEKVVQQANLTTNNNSTRYLVLDDASAVIQKKIINLPSYAQLYLNQNTTPTTVSGSAYTQIALSGINFSNTVSTSDWTMLSPGVLKYVGSPTRVFRVSYIVNAYSSTNNQLVGGQLRINASVLNTSYNNIMCGTLSGASSASGNIQIENIVQLNTDDTISVWIANLTSNNNVIVANFNLNVSSLN
jgi:hypothetical protein